MSRGAELKERLKGEGKTALENDQPVIACPYVTQTEREHWTTGWYQAERERRHRDETRLGLWLDDQLAMNGLSEFPGTLARFILRRTQPGRHREIPLVFGDLHLVIPPIATIGPNGLVIPQETQTDEPPLSP